MGTVNVKKITAILKKHYNATSALHFKNPLEILIATILSAQCTDKRVNIVTQNLFKKYKTADAYAKADLSGLEQEIRSTGFYRNKAKNIKVASAKIVKEFRGRVPSQMDKLITLPGVARKTANIVLWNGYGKNEGIAVDTHVKRVAFRLGLTRNTDPEKIEKDLMPLIPQKEWGVFSHLIVAHGRQICTARNPKCSICPLGKYCPKIVTSHESQVTRSLGN